jgi:hypothetical protein
MRNELQLPNFCVFYEKKNTSSNTHYQINNLFLNDKISKEIIKKNELDIELYEYAKKNIFLKYKKKFGKNLHKEISSFSKNNVNFKFCQKKRFFLICYRWIIHRNIEYALWRKMHKI